MADADAQGALLSAAYTFLTTGANALGASDISWPNVAFDSAGKSLWASVHFVPNDPTPVSLGNQGLDRGTGFMQIDLNVPVNTGDVTLRAMENKGRAFFIVGKTFTQSGQAVRVISCGMSPGRIVDNFWRKHLTIAYRTDFTRTSIT